MQNIHYVPASNMVKEKLAGFLDGNYNLFVSGEKGSGKSFLIDELVAQMKRPLNVEKHCFNPHSTEDILDYLHDYEERQPGASMDTSKQTSVTITEAIASSEYDMGILLTQAQDTFADKNGYISNDHKRHVTHLFTLMVYIDTCKSDTDIVHYIKKIKLINYSGSITIFHQSVLDLKLDNVNTYKLR